MSDLFDPRRGSEFQVPQLALRALGRHTTLPVTLWTTRRADNESAIRAWLEEQDLSDRVTLRLSPLRHGDADGHHPTRLHFLLDLVSLYRTAAHGIRRGDRVWKCGQTNVVFNLIALVWLRCDVLGPLSGLEAPITGAVAHVRKRYQWRTVAYSALLAAARAALRLAHRRHRVRALVVATQADHAVLSPGLQEKAVQHLEVDLQTLLNTSVQSADGHSSRNTGPTVLWSGALIDRKNPLLALEILARVLRERDDVTALMVGDGHLREMVLARLAALEPPIQSRLIWQPALERAPFLALLAQADVLLVTSLREVNSVLVLEALASDVPVVASSVSGLRETVPAAGGLYDLRAADVVESATHALLNFLGHAPRHSTQDATAASARTASPRDELLRFHEDQRRALANLVKERFT